MKRSDLPAKITGKLYEGTHPSKLGRRLWVHSIIQHGEEETVIRAAVIYPIDPISGKPNRPAGHQLTSTMKLSSLCHSYRYVETLPVDVVSNYLGRSRAAIEEMCESGKLDAVNINGHWKCVRDAVTKLRRSEQPVMESSESMDQIMEGFVVLNEQTKQMATLSDEFVNTVENGVAITVKEGDEPERIVIADNVITNSAPERVVISDPAAAPLNTPHYATVRPPEPRRTNFWRSAWHKFTRLMTGR